MCISVLQILKTRHVIIYSFIKVHSSDLNFIQANILYFLFLIRSIISNYILFKLAEKLNGFLVAAVILKNAHELVSGFVIVCGFDIAV